MDPKFPRHDAKESFEGSPELVADPICKGVSGCLTSRRIG